MVRGNKASGVVDIGGRSPTKRNATTYKKPTTPLKAKKHPAVKRGLDMVVSRLVIAHTVWKKLLRTYFGKCWTLSNEKGRSWIQRSRNLLSLQRRDLEGSTVRGMTRCGGGDSPTLPHKEMAPEASLSISVSEINWANGLQDRWLVKIRAGGLSQS